jgi:hypothetical protein
MAEIKGNRNLYRNTVLELIKVLFIIIIIKDNDRIITFLLPPSMPPQLSFSVNHC